MGKVTIVGEPDSRWTRGIPDYELQELHDIVEGHVLEYGDAAPIHAHLKEELERRGLARIRVPLDRSDDRGSSC